MNDSDIPLCVELTTFKSGVESLKDELAPLEASPPPSDVGQAPLEVGQAPFYDDRLEEWLTSLDATPVEQKPLNVGQKPLDVGQKPLEVGQKPLDVGLTSLEVGLTSLDASIPLDIDQLPLATNISQINIELPLATNLSKLNVGFNSNICLKTSRSHKDDLSHKELAYPDGIYQYILKMCCFHPINIFAGFYYGNPLGGTMGVLLLMTSVNYWRKPLMNSVRRYIDMAVAFTTVPYHMYLSLFTTNKLLCAVPIVTGALSYPFSIWLQKKNYIKTAAFFHCVLHGLTIAGVTLTYRDYYLYPK